MLHDPEGMQLRLHALLGLKGEEGCTLMSWLHLAMLLAAAVVGLYLPSPVEQKCGVGFGHPKHQGRNAKLMNSKNNGAIKKNSESISYLVSAVHSTMRFNSLIQSKKNAYLFPPASEMRQEQI